MLSRSGRAKPTVAGREDSNSRCRAKVRCLPIGEPNAHDCSVGRGAGSVPARGLSRGFFPAVSASSGSRRPLAGAHADLLLSVRSPLHAFAVSRFRGGHVLELPFFFASTAWIRNAVGP